jgi:signal transduction histidine kinase/CheY-like chemotaxis protein
MVRTQFLSRQVGRFVRVVSGHDESGNPQLAYQLQVFAISILSLLAACVVYAPAYYWVGDPIGALAIGLGLLPGAIAILVYRKTRSPYAALQVVSVGTFVLTGFLTYHQGGMASPVAPWMILVPFSLLTAGLPSASLAWSGAVIVEMGIFSALSASGHAYPQRDYPLELINVISLPGLLAVLCMFLFLVDRTRRHAHAELEATNAALATARDSALDAVRAKSAFLANMSHEIRTPLNGVLGAAEVLTTTPLTLEQARLVETLKQSGDGLLTLINDILDFSKIEARRLTLECVPLDPEQKIEAVADLFAAQAAEKGLEISWHTRPGVPAAVMGDPNRLRQILSNLIGNAVKFTDCGEIEVDLSARATDTPGTVELRFAVRDTGTGMAPEALARLFQPFTQADSSTTRVYGGSGLGLAISQDLARAMGGHIEVTSKVGAGTVFTLVLPARVAAPSEGAAPGRPLAGKTVRILEPHSGTLRMLVRAVEALGGSVRTAATLQALDDETGTGAPERIVLVAEAYLHVVVDSAERDALSRLASRAAILMVGAPGSRVGDGLPFTVRGVLHKPVTPRRLADQLAAMDGDRDGVEPARPTPTDRRLGLHLLVAEDNVVNQKIALAMLSRLGCTAEIATQGAAAVVAWKSGEFDAVLMDCQMPVMDGYEATRQIRALEAANGRPRTPIVALTANALTGDRELCLAAGMDDHLGKPFTLDQLRTALGRWASDSPLARTA